MMHLEAIKGRNRKPARHPEVIETSRYAGEARLANSPQHTAAWRVSPWRQSTQRHCRNTCRAARLPRL